MHKLCVVYLARASNGVGPVETFVNSYARFASGAEHDLLFALKGFASREDGEKITECAHAYAPRMLHVKDFGFDLRAFGLAARRFDYEFFCLLNSFSEIQADGWLAKLYTPLMQDGVGLVGATGSFESRYSNTLAESRDPRWYKRAWRPVRLAARGLAYAPFPNCHLRTNSIVISRRHLLAIWPALVLTKRSAYRFESGRRGLTQKMLDCGLKVLVATRDGKTYEPGQWAQSRTFRQGRQENLLVADNQTRLFDAADLDTRKRLSFLAWGAEASPAKD